jgi:hypothetical protein
LIRRASRRPRPQSRNARKARITLAIAFASAAGSQTFHTDRSFIPADLRLPVERGAGTSYFAPGSDIPYRIVGKPIQLISRGGGVLALDAGLTIVGDPLVHHGHLSVGFGHDGDAAYLRQFYCPWANA